MINVAELSAGMSQLERSWNAKADECVALVVAGDLTPDEAAQALHSADIKEREALAETGCRFSRSRGIEAARQAINSRLETRTPQQLWSDDNNTAVWWSGPGLYAPRQENVLRYWKVESDEDARQARLGTPQWVSKPSELLGQYWMSALSNN